MNISEIAKRANVSRSTVSRVLNNDPKVGANTRKTVLRVIEEMKYIPSAAARSLASRKNNKIGVLIENISQSYWSALFTGIEQHMTEAGYRIVFANSHFSGYGKSSQNNYKASIRDLIGQGIDGIIFAIADSIDENDVEYLKSINMPYTVVQNYFPSDSVTSINIDNFTAAYDVTCYLINSGHRNIIHAYGLQGAGVAEDRLRGFKEAMSEHGLPFEENVFPCGAEFHDGYDFMKKIMRSEKLPTGIVFGNDVTAYGACLYAKENGISIPGDISVVGFDYLAKHVDVAAWLPDLTTMGTSVKKIGYLSAQMLISLISGEEPASKVIRMSLYKGNTVKRIISER